MLNALTVDVEDYYHVSAFESVVPFEEWDRFESRVERNTHVILDLMDEYKTKATFFVLGWVAQRQPTLVRAISQRGHEVGSHGYAHRRIYNQTPSQFREDISETKKIIEDIIGQAIIGYRAASYSITLKSLWGLEILAEEGFWYDSSIFPIWHDLYGIPGHRRFLHVVAVNGGKKIVEIPLSTIRVAGINIPVGGGGYLRMFPYALTHLAIRHLNQKERQPAVVYFHPWEIDLNQPQIQGSWMSRFRHYTNLAQMERKLRMLLATFAFGPIREVHASCLNGHGA